MKRLGTGVKERNSFLLLPRSSRVSSFATKHESVASSSACQNRNRTTRLAGFQHLPDATPSNAVDQEMTSKHASPTCTFEFRMKACFSGSEGSRLTAQQIQDQFDSQGEILLTSQPTDALQLISPVHSHAHVNTFQDRMNSHSKSSTNRCCDSAMSRMTRERHSPALGHEGFPIGKRSRRSISVARRGAIKLLCWSPREGCFR